MAARGGAPDRGGGREAPKAPEGSAAWGGGRSLSLSLYRARAMMHCFSHLLGAHVDGRQAYRAAPGGAGRARLGARRVAHLHGGCVFVVREGRCCSLSLSVVVLSLYVCVRCVSRCLLECVCMRACVCCVRAREARRCFMVERASTVSRTSSDAILLETSAARAIPGPAPAAPFRVPCVLVLHHANECAPPDTRAARARAPQSFV